MLNRYLILLLIFISHYANGQSLKTLQDERDKLKKEIDYNNSLLEKNKKDLNYLFSNYKINKIQILNREALIKNLDAQIALISGNIADKEIQISNSEKKLVEIKTEYANMIYNSWTTKQKQNSLMYIFSGTDFDEIVRRYRYYIEFTNYRRSQAENIDKLTSLLKKEHSELNIQKLQLKRLIDEKNIEKNNLVAKKLDQEKSMSSLKENEKRINSDLAKYKKRVDDLNKFIERLIIAESKKRQKERGSLKLTPEEQKLSSEFGRNLGKLPWPVSKGVIVSKFGVSNVGTSGQVKIDNSGIEIETEKGSNVRAVFEGIVTVVMNLPGSNMGVIIRHGDYLTFYANLSGVNVVKGDKVVLKQTLGTVFVDKITGKSLLNFQVWKEGSNGVPVKLNPESWLMK